MDLFFDSFNSKRDRRIVRKAMARRYGSFGGGLGTLLIGGDLAGTVGAPTVQGSHFKGNPVFDVQAYGAVGNGVADDTVAIQAAFNALPASGGTVFFPTGTYKVTDTISYTGKTNFKVIGPGKIVQVTAGKRILTFTTCTNFTIEDLFFYGVGTDFNPAADTNGDAIFLDTCTGFVVKDCQFQNFGHSAICPKICSKFTITGNSIEGTHAFGTAIASGDNYQFGMLIKWDGATGCTDFEVSGNSITNVAIGIRVEPKCRRFVLCDNTLNLIRGQHGFYINGQDMTISGNVVYSVAVAIGVGIKLQSFWIAGPTTDEIIGATVTGNSVDTCLSGITCEHLAGAPQSSNVVISGNSVKNAGNAGYGIYVKDVDNLTISGNALHGGAHGIVAGQTEAAKGCSGAIDSNTITDTQWAGIYGLTHESLKIRGNRIVRPCLAAIATDPQQDAIYAQGQAAAKRIEVSGNNVLVDTSTGVVKGLLLFQCQAWVGDNDWDDKPVTLSAVTLRKQTWCSDLSGTSAWTPGAIANGAKAISTFAVTNAAVGDFVLVSFNQDLQGCSLAAYVSSAGNVSVTITNNTGGSITPAGGTIRYLVMHKIN